MYLNVISFTNGKVVPFRTKIPYSVDKVTEGWNVVTDEANGQVISFRGVYIVTIASEDEEKIKTVSRDAPPLSLPVKRNRRSKRE